MRLVLSELEAAVLETQAAGDTPEELIRELEQTRKQLDALLNPDS